MGERDREPIDYPLRAPETTDEVGAPETTARTGPVFTLVGTLGLVFLGGIVVVVIVALVSAL